MLTQVQHSVPKFNLNALPANITLPELNLDNLDILNQYANGGVDLYLTSKDDISKNPSWLEGQAVAADGSISDAKTTVVIVAEKAGGIVDAFYVTFYAYNWGGIVLDQNLGKFLSSIISRMH